MLLRDRFTGKARRTTSMRTRRGPKDNVLLGNMCAQKNRIRTDNLCRLMSYVLGHRPDEFGLVPDENGFVTYKELLWAIHEEANWGYVRQGHIDEVLFGKDRSLFQSEGNRIRSVDRHWHLDLVNPSESLPKILFIAVRKKAHPHVMENGLLSNHGTCLVLSPDNDMAYRIGKRRDQEPVLLEIMASTAQREDISFYPFGSLFLAHRIPVRFIHGPPLPKEEPKKPIQGAVKRQKRRPELEAGTFVLDLNRDPDLYRRTRGKKQKGWKEEARRIRRKKKR